MGLHNTVSVAFKGVFTYGNNYNRGMDAIVNIFILFILGIIAVIILGLVAGFSPTLYLAQVTTAALKKKNNYKTTVSLAAGVVAATVILLVLFQIFSLSSLLDIIDSTVRALLVSVVFNIVVGLLFIFGGLRYLHTSDAKNAYDASPKSIKKYKGTSALFGFGFIKTSISISGVTAIFVGGNIIASASGGFLERIILTLIFLAASIAPFFALLYFLDRKPEQLTSIVNKVKIQLSKFNYRTTVGVASVILGGAIVIFNVMMALFY